MIVYDIILCYYMLLYYIYNIILSYMFLYDLIRSYMTLYGIVLYVELCRYYPYLMVDVTPQLFLRTISQATSV